MSDDFETVRSGLARLADAVDVTDPLSQGSLDAGERAEAALDRIQAELVRLQKQNKRLCDFVEAVESAHKEHLRTGDYVRLGMAAQDALRALMAPPCA